MTRKYKITIMKTKEPNANITFVQFYLCKVHRPHRNPTHWSGHSKALGHNDFRVLLLYIDEHKLKPLRPN